MYLVTPKKCKKCNGEGCQTCMDTGIRCACGGFWQNGGFIHADECELEQREEFLFQVKETRK